MLVSPALDPNSTTVEVWVQAANPEGKLRPGSTVRVSMVAQTVPDALVIPASALLSTPDGTTTVMLAGADGRAHQQAVETGIRHEDAVQIVKGLKPGDTPAGSSLQETNRILTHIEQILHSTPEVESTSRRTGMQLGLAAVTEANRGDIAVKLKSRRSRDIEEIILHSSFMDDMWKAYRYVFVVTQPAASLLPRRRLMSAD